MVLRLKALLGRDRSFPGLDRVVFLLFFYCDKCLLGVEIVFCFFRDNVATEVPLS